MRSGLRSCSKSNLHGLWGWQETHITHKTRWGATVSQEKPLIYSISQQLLLRSNKCEWSESQITEIHRKEPFSFFPFYSHFNLTVTVSATIKHIHSKNGTATGRERFAVNRIKYWLLKVIDAEMRKGHTGGRLDNKAVTKTGYNNIT